MARIEYPRVVNEMVAELKRLPGIGARSAERIAIWLLQNQTLTGMSVHNPANWGGFGDSRDTFALTTAETGGASHFVEIQFSDSLGDLDMRLYDAGMNPLRTSLSVSVTVMSVSSG